MAWNTPRTWVAGSAVAAADLNADIRDNSTWLKAAAATHGITSDSTPQVLLSAGYGCSLTVSGWTVATDTDSGVQFTTEEWDDAGFHANSPNPQRITIPTGGDGRYIFTAWVEFDTNSSGRRIVWFEKNLATAYNRVQGPPASAGDTGMVTTCELDLVAGDFLIVRARQSSGGNLDVDARFQARRVSV